MLRVAHILTPVDPASATNPALAQALMWAEHLDATVHALEVREAEGDSLPSQPLEAQPSDAVREAVCAQANQLPFASPACRSARAMRMRAPTVAHGLMHYAARHPIDLIVVLPGHTAWERVGLPPHLLATLAQQSDQPLLMVQPPSLDAPGAGNLPIRRVLAPVDFSQHAQRGLDCATAVATLYDVPLDVLHVLERPPYVALNAIDLLSLSDATLPVRRAERRIQALLDRSPEAQAESTIHVKHGEPAHAIASFAQAHHSDLVIFSSHGSTGQAQHALGTVAQKLVRRLDTSLLLLKSFGAPITTLSPSSRAST